LKASVIKQLCFSALFVLNYFFFTIHFNSVPLFRHIVKLLTASIIPLCVVAVVVVDVDVHFPHQLIKLLGKTTKDFLRAAL